MKSSGKIVKTSKGWRRTDVKFIAGWHGYFESSDEANEIVRARARRKMKAEY